MLDRKILSIWRIHSKEYIARNYQQKAWDTVVYKLKEINENTGKIYAIKNINMLKI